jgi:hypothetical protein
MRPCPELLLTNNTDRGWLGRTPTLDEREVVEWMHARAIPKRILHVGVGNALLSAEFGTRVVQGITRDGSEAVHGRSLGLDVIVCNKYDVASYSARLSEPFDCIVDVNVRSYACCDSHFKHYLDRLLAALSYSGMLLTNKRGLDYQIPTSLPELRRLADGWKVRIDGNVMIMRPQALLRLRKWAKSRRASVS